MAIQKVYQLSLVDSWLSVNLEAGHELVILAGRLDWASLTEELAVFYSLNGRKAKAPRLMVALHILKHMYNLSDEQVVKSLKENIYYRYFCGLHLDLKEWHKQNPVNSSTMTRFRNRIGASGMKVIEDIVRKQLVKERCIKTKTQVVDTTAMEKNIAYPTDTSLLNRGIETIVRGVKQLKKLGLSIDVRSYARVTKKEILRVAKLGRGRRERINQATKKLIGYAKQVLSVVPVAARAIKKKAGEQLQKRIDKTKESLKTAAELVERVITQSRKRLEGVHIKNKVLSIHEPTVVVIAKGKRKQRYEYGSKVSLMCDRNGFVTGHQEYQSNIADNNTLDAALEDFKETYGKYPDEMAADRGYHTKEPSEILAKVRVSAIPRKGKKKHPSHKASWFRRLQRQRNKIEPVIGHLKKDHRMDKCRYKGPKGDNLNVGFATCAWNLKKWARQVSQEQKQVA